MGRRTNTGAPMTSSMKSALQLSIVALLVILAPPIARADPATQPALAQAREFKIADFMRLADRGAAGGKLETADAAFRNADGVTVHLVAAVHIGEEEYFQGLN